MSVCTICGMMWTMATKMMEMPTSTKMLVSDAADRDEVPSASEAQGSTIADHQAGKQLDDEQLGANAHAILEDADRVILGPARAAKPHEQHACGDHDDRIQPAPRSERR